MTLMSYMCLCISVRNITHIKMSHPKICTVADDSLRFLPQLCDYHFLALGPLLHTHPLRKTRTPSVSAIYRHLFPSPLRHLFPSPLRSCSDIIRIFSIRNIATHSYSIKSMCVLTSYLFIVIVSYCIYRFKVTRKTCSTYLLYLSYLSCK